MIHFRTKAVGVLVVMGLVWAWPPAEFEPAPSLPGSLLGLAACLVFDMFPRARCNLLYSNQGSGGAHTLLKSTLRQKSILALVLILSVYKSEFNFIFFG